MKDKPYFAVVYMFVVTAFFSAILIGFARLTRENVEANQRLAFEKAVLEAFPGIEATTNSQVHQIFTDQFEQSPYGYIYRYDGRLKGYAVPVEGQGFWAPIKGVVGIAPDRKTVTGLAFYEQSETPGLGARIVEPDFCGKFEGLKLGTQGQPIGLKQSGTELKENQVHSITGATQTCVRLEKLINNGLLQWQRAMNQQEGQ